MTLFEKIRLDIPVLLPEVPDTRDACVSRLDAMLIGQPGIIEAHLVDAQASAKLCVQYEPDTISLQRVRALALAAGARLTERYGHLVADIAETSTPRTARNKAQRLSQIDGVLEADLSGAGGLRVEYDRDAISDKALRAAIADLGLTIRQAYGEPAHEHASHDHDHRDHDGHNHDGHSHSHSHGDSRVELGFALAAGFFVLLGWLLPKFVDLSAPWMQLAPLWAAYFFGGYFTAKEAIEHIRNRSFEIDLLMLVAAIGAAALGEWVEGGLLL